MNTKTVTVSLKGLGYTNQTAHVTYRNALDDGSIFEVLKGAPTIECAKVELPMAEQPALVGFGKDEKLIDGERLSRFAKDAAWSVAFRMWQEGRI